MKRLFFLVLFSGFSCLIMAQANSSTRYQSGYVKSNGTYVESHMKTNINTTNHDNFTTNPNTNSFTGEKGTRAPDYSLQAQNYGQGHIIQTGERGGQYYVIAKGTRSMFRNSN